MAQKKKPADYSQEPQVNVLESTKTSKYDVFTIVEHNGEFLVAVGNQIVTKERFASEEDAKNYIDSKPWELILNTVAVMMSKIAEQEKAKQQTQSK